MRVPLDISTWATCALIKKTKKKQKKKQKKKRKRKKKKKKKTWAPLGQWVRSEQHAIMTSWCRGQGHARDKAQGCELRDKGPLKILGGSCHEERRN